MKKYMLFLIFFLLLLPLNVRAIDYENYCGHENNAKLKKIASNVNVKYDVVEKNNNVTFNVTLSNLHKELLVVDELTGKEYSYTDENQGELKITGYKSGQSLTYTFYFRNKYCSETVLAVKYVNLPAYNPYYKNSVCNGLNDYSLCQKWVKHGLDREEFIERVNQYRESLNIDLEPDNNDDVKGIFDYIFEFFFNYYMYILPAIIICGTGGIIYLNKKNSFEFLK